MSSPSTNQQQYFLQPSPPQRPPLQPPPATSPGFQPFFTLIAPTPTSSSHAHPHVHYIFADDPTDPTLDLPPPNGRDRIITVDIDIDPQRGGAFVREAHSLSRDYQLVNATVTEAPQMAGEECKGGQMLVIEGVELGLRGVKPSLGIAELARVFSERMEILRRVVEFGGGPTEGEPLELGMELHPSQWQQQQRQTEGTGGEDTADETVTETEGETSADEGSLF